MIYRRSVAWLRAHPVASDRIAAAVLLAVAIPALWLIGKKPRFREPDVWGVLLTVAAVLPVAWRRWRPDLVVVVSATAQFTSLVVGYPTGAVFLAVGLAIYTYACHRERRAEFWPAVVWVVELLLLVPLAPFHRSAGNIAGLMVATAAAWIVGDAVRSRRLERQRFLERAEFAEREREAKARAATAEERAVIAREIHDVVAHALGVVVMLSAGAGRKRDLDVAQARDALAGIESTSRQAFGEMRQLVSVLRKEGAHAETAPQPTIDDIASLAFALRDAGLDVSLVETGARGTLSNGAELSVYRIVQEALTNSLRHAAGAAVRVTLAWTPISLNLDVENDPPANGSSTSSFSDTGGDGGHGIVGMRERVRLFGGEFHADPMPSGGFRVVASLPLEPQS